MVIPFVRDLIRKSVPTFRDHALEYLRAPGFAVGAEERVGPRNSTIAQFAHAHRTGKVREAETAEIDTAERGHLAGEIGRRIRLRRAAACDTPAPGIPRTEFVRDLHDDRSEERR